MPNIITHVLFARELKETKLSESEKKKLENRDQLYEIGANGSDYLFFHGINKKRFYQKSKLRDLGHYVHRRGTNDFYRTALEVIRNEREEDVKADEVAYIMGHLTHWALDSTAHPYIFYRTGSGDQASKTRHHKMESLLDAILLKVKTGQTIHDFKVYEVCDVPIEDVRAISRVYVRVAKDVYNMEIQPHQVLESLNDWYGVQKKLYDNTGTKLKALITMEKSVGAPGLVSGLIVPNNPEDPCDVCNLLHNEWVHPCDKEKKSTDSFMDLYNLALEKAEKAIGLFLAAVEDSSNEEAFIQFLDNRNYTKGLSDNPKMVYFDPNMETNGKMMVLPQE